VTVAIDRQLFDSAADVAAPLLLGALLTHETPTGRVTVRLTEVEAYSGQGLDPGSHAHRGRTNRNAVMFGPSGYLYTYFTYGVHVCANVVCLPEGEAAGILLRAGEIVEGEDSARQRRGFEVPFRDLGRGPARLAKALGIPLSDGGADLFTEPYGLEFPSQPVEYLAGPRTGVSGPGGSLEYPWRFWIPGERSVSAYKAHVPKKRTSDRRADSSSSVSG
jgi:DNA-3-methyladenine glycosylase